MTVRTGVPQEFPDLTILNAASGTAVLTLHTGRVLPLLQETGLINHQGIIGRVEVVLDLGTYLIAHAIHLPVRATQNRLKGRRRCMTGVLGYLPAIPPFNLAQ